MSDPYIGEIRLFGGSYAPYNWAFCDGALLQISQYSTLYSLIGTAYGGDGVTNFALPDLAGRIAVGQGNGTGLTPRALGQKGGEEQHQLISPEMPAHTHGINVTTKPGSLPGPAANAIPATPTGGTAKNSLYVVPGTSTMQSAAMTQAAILPFGSSQAHDNMMPTVCVSYIICLTGIFPSRN